MFSIAVCAVLVLLVVFLSVLAVSSYAPTYTSALARARVMAGASGNPSEEAAGGAENLALKMKVALAGVRKRFSKVKVAPASELVSTMDKLHLSENSKTRILILDVREKEEYDVSHLPDAKWINESKPMEQKIEEVRKLVTALNDTNECENIRIFAYCSIGYRSSALISQFAQRTQNLPDNVHFYDIQGGIFQWANDGRAMVDVDNKPTKYVHPYNFVWGKLVQKQFRYKATSAKD